MFAAERKKAPVSDWQFNIDLDAKPRNTKNASNEEKFAG